MTPNERGKKFLIEAKKGILNLESDEHYEDVLFTKILLESEKRRIRIRYFTGIFGCKKVLKKLNEEIGVDLDYNHTVEHLMGW